MLLFAACRRRRRHLAQHMGAQHLLFGFLIPSWLATVSEAVADAACSVTGLIMVLCKLACAWLAFADHLSWNTA